MHQNKKLMILFLCTGNARRSQMAEGWARALKSDTIEPYSAGVEPHEIDPLVIKVMAEAGVDISSQRSKNVSEFRDFKFDYVITVCGNANENCPIFPGNTKVVHVGFDDPGNLALTAKTNAEAMTHYRHIRDEIKKFVESLPEMLTTLH